MYVIMTIALIQTCFHICRSLDEKWICNLVYALRIIAISLQMPSLCYFNWHIIEVVWVFEEFSNDFQGIFCIWPCPINNSLPCVISSYIQFNAFQLVNINVIVFLIINQKNHCSIIIKFWLRFYFVAQRKRCSYWCSFNGLSKVFKGSNFQRLRLKFLTV